MSKNNKRTREVLCSFTAPVTLSSPADRLKLGSHAKMFFEQVGNYCASLGIAWPTGLHLKLRDGTRVFERPQLKGRPVTEREKEFLRQLVLPMFWEYCMSLPLTRADQEKIKRKKDQHEKTVFGKLRNDKDKCAGAEFWMRWRNALLCHQENPNRVSFVIAPMRMEHKTPQFWQGFFEAMRTSARYGNKDPTDKWLIEHEEVIKNLTPREVKQRFGSQFQATSIRKIHERLNELSLAHKHEPSGKASPNYRPFRRES